MTRPDLIKLREATSNAIDAVRYGSEYLEAINWGDLYCSGAVWVEYDDGSARAVVTIEEASPNCPIFQAAIQAELRKAGWLDIDVVTEW